MRYSWSEDATQLQVQPASSLIIFLFFHFHVRLKFFHRERVLRPVQLVWRSVKSQARPASSPLGCFRITLSTLKKKKKKKGLNKRATQGCCLLSLPLHSFRYQEDEVIEERKG